MKEAREKLLYHNMSDEERRAYDEHLSDIMIQNDALDGAKLEGRMEGELLKQREIATNMKQLGADIQFISQVTGLTAEEIGKL